MHCFPYGFLTSLICPIHQASLIHNFHVIFLSNMSVFSKKKKKNFYSFPKNLLLPSCSGRLSSPSFSVTQKTNSLLVHLLRERERENPSFNNCLLDGLLILTDL